MLKTIANAWKVPDLRKKMLFTIFIVFIFRFGSAIPVPFLDVEALRQLTSSWNETNNMLSYFDMFSGGAFSNATLFAMSVTPYINSSIIMQLLSVAIPALERLSKEGTEGRKKIGTITRYVTVALGIIQGTAYYIYLLRSQVKAEDGSIHNIVQYQGWNLSGIFSAITIIMVFTAGTALMMWLGEQINQNGLGNGISILLFVGIIARLPVTMLVLWDNFQVGLAGQTMNIVYTVAFVVIFLIIIWVIVFMNDAERRIPVMYAKRVVGSFGRYADHFRKLDPLYSPDYPDVYRSEQSFGFLEGLLQYLQPDKLGIYYPVFHHDHRIRLFLCNHSVQSGGNVKQSSSEQRHYPGYPSR